MIWSQETLFCSILIPYANTLINMHTYVTLVCSVSLNKSDKISKSKEKSKLVCCSKTIPDRYTILVRKVSRLKVSNGFPFQHFSIGCYGKNGIQTTCLQLWATLFHRSNHVKITDGISFLIITPDSLQMNRT